MICVAQAWFAQATCFVFGEGRAFVNAPLPLLEHPPFSRHGFGQSVKSFATPFQPKLMNRELFRIEEDAPVLRGDPPGQLRSQKLEGS
jgi:hypothetical protein